MKIKPPTQPKMLICTEMFLLFAGVSLHGKLEFYKEITLSCLFGSILATYLAYRK